MKIRSAFIATLMMFGIPFAAGCAAESQPDREDDSASQMTPVQVEEAEAANVDEEMKAMSGCTNAEIRASQDWCRRPDVCPGGSRGIHWCDYNAGCFTFRCDCTTATDRQFTACY